jgi:uncharacterized DUF497 family protein
MNGRFAGFEWDDGNCEKHGVTVAQIEALLAGSPRIVPDLKHSANEDRYIAVGRDTDGRAMFVAFTIREHMGERLIRPVSARYMHRKEIEGYEDEAEGS